MSIVAQTLYETACRLHAAERCKWTFSSEVSTLLSACEEASGIPHWVLRTAMCEKVTNDLLSDLFDVCKGDLRQNTGAAKFFTRVERTDRYGNTREDLEALTIPSPLHAIVTRYLADIRYLRHSADNLVPSDFNGKQARFHQFIAARLAQIEPCYTPECFAQLRKAIEIEGGVA